MSGIHPSPKSPCDFDPPSRGGLAPRQVPSGKYPNLRISGLWAVTIRAGEVEETRLRLYAGAGIVAGSDPALELAETSAKLNTLLRILGVPCDSQGTDS